MGKPYKNPPIVEAVCEVRFAPSSSWDLTTPGLIYESLGKDQGTFPLRRTVRQLEAALLVTADGSPQQQFTESEGIRLVSRDERAFVQLAPNVVSVHKLAPYASWNEYKPLVEQVIEACVRIASPPGVQRIGLRYVNRIVVPVSGLRTEDYFEFYPFLGTQLPQEHGAFVVGVTFGYDENQNFANLRMSSAPPGGPHEYVVVLDVDYFTGSAESVGLARLGEWLEIAHDRIETAFEGSITDRTRALFEGEAR